ncbi:JAB domain-containing protein [Novosphingobium guangzhouense]|uniref:JAB domain-containing protein n=1 Tax=Novosphingobium guangzhouense TaxID=1850347 RepID=UPI001B80CF8D|nr:JAB domain-containing protein [Novosphingobium guangzhouense]
MAFHPKYPLLAALDHGASWSRSAGSHWRSLRARLGLGGLHDSCGDVELDRTGSSARGNPAALQTVASVGCRRVLEELIGITDPQHAGFLSSQLLGRFGSLAGTLAARRRDRTMILGDASMVEETFQRVSAAVRHLLPGDTHVVNYLRGVMAFDPVEQFRILFLNASSELIADELMAVGTVSAVHVYPREVMKRCIELGATAIILAHNHPSGNPEPSQIDRDTTVRIAQAARSLDIIIHDHFIVARSGVVSFRRAGYLK